MCGENSGISFPSHRGRGSPPRVRGKQIEAAPDGERDRITPACAGKTYIGGRWYAFDKDHPRVCGENKSSSAGFFRW